MWSRQPGWPLHGRLRRRRRWRQEKRRGGLAVSDSALCCATAPGASGAECTRPRTTSTCKQAPHKRVGCRSDCRRQTPVRAGSHRGVHGEQRRSSSSTPLCTVFGEHPRDSAKRARFSFRNTVAAAPELTRGAHDAGRRRQACVSASAAAAVWPEAASGGRGRRSCGGGAQGKCCTSASEPAARGSRPPPGRRGGGHHAQGESRAVSGGCTPDNSLLSPPLSPPSVLPHAHVCGRQVGRLTRHSG